MTAVAEFLECEQLSGHEKLICRGEAGFPLNGKNSTNAFRLKLWNLPPIGGSEPKPKGSVFFAKPMNTTPLPRALGVGGHLRKLTKKLWIKTCGACKDHADEMDRHGIAWCEKNIETIVGWMKEAADKMNRGWLVSMTEILPEFGFTPRELVEQSIAAAKVDKLAGEVAKKKRAMSNRGDSAIVGPPLIGVPIDRAKLTSNIIYHVMPLAGETEWVWRRHLDWLREVRQQFNGRLLVGIVTRGDGDTYNYCDPGQVREACSGLDAEFFEAPNDVKTGHRRGIGEGTLFTPMLAALETSDPNSVAFYGHCKGVTRPGPRDSVPNRWAEFMFETTFRNHDEIVGRLDQSGVCGSFLMQGGHRPGLPGLGPRYFFSGTFYAVRLVDVFRRNWRAMGSTYGCVEQWPNKIFRLGSEVSCIFQDDVGNLYDEPAWKSTIEPAFAQWKANKNKAALM